MRPLILTFALMAAGSAYAQEEVLVLPADTRVVGCEILGSATFTTVAFGAGQKAIARLQKRYTDRAKELGANVVLLTIQRIAANESTDIRPGVFLRCPLPIMTEDPTLRIKQD